MFKLQLSSRYFLREGILYQEAQTLTAHEESFIEMYTIQGRSSVET